MGTLSRDIDAYQRALAVYQRRAKSYNNSIVKDANGNPYLIGKGDYDPVQAYATQGGLPAGAFKVADSSTGKVSAAQGNVPFVGATDNGDPNFLLLRNNPQGYETRVFSGVRNIGGGVDDSNNPIPDKFVMNNGPVDSEGSPTAIPVDMTKAKVLGQPDENGNYTIEYSVPKFTDRPDDFTQKAPNPSTAEIRRDQRPSMAAQEGGLIGEVIGSRGLKGSGSFPGQRGAINQARDDRAAAAKLEQEKLTAEKARLEAEEAARNTPVDYGGGG